VGERRCPSCGVEPNELKFDVKIVGETAGLKYRHKPECTIGRAVPWGTSSPHFRCSQCSTVFSLTDETPIRYLDGGGFASLDCPLCWARAEAEAVAG
jgi:hypothetical protein